ncbi:purine-binding chemotaxis protein CheW [bacterium]|nr:purine-binding chemotaxis protein CheW [bacterium]
MDENRHCVVFSLDDRYFALQLSSVERIARAVAVTPLPHAPDIVLGVINIQGRVLPVVNIRKRFGLSETPIHADQHFIVGKTDKTPVAILVDNVHDIIEISENHFVKHDDIISHIPYLSGVLKQDDNMVLVHDLEKLLSADEVHEIHTAIQDMDATPGPKKSRKPSSGKKKST